MHNVTKLMEKSKYNEAAAEFLHYTQAKISKEFKKIGKHFEGDKNDRPIYLITISKGERKYSFNFGESINHLQENKQKIKVWGGAFFKKHLDELLAKNPPSDYSILAALEKHDVGSFENFCSEFGYEQDSRKAEKIYNSVKNEFKSLQIIFTDKELELMQDIA